MSFKMIDEGLAVAGRRLRMRKAAGMKPEEEREDGILKDLGLFENGMSREDKKKLLAVVAASKTTATFEKKSRQIGDKFDGSMDIDPEFFIYDKTDREHSSPMATPPTAVEDSRSSSPTSPCLIMDSNHSSPKVVSETPDIFDTILQSPKSAVEPDSDVTLKRLESVNEDSLSPGLHIGDNVKQKYDRKQINPLDFIEDVQAMKLIDKRNIVTKDESYWSCCCPNGIRHKDFAKSLLQSFEMYHKDLYAFQRRSLNFMKWGAPVVVGRHCADTLDVWRSRQYVKSMDDSEETIKEEEEMRESRSDNEFDKYIKKDDSAKRKYNFTSKGRTYGRNVQEKSVESKKDVFSFDGSSDENGSAKEDVRKSRFPDRSREGKIEISSEDSAEDESDGYIPCGQPAAKKSRSLRLGLSKASEQRKGSCTQHVLAKSFYGKSANEALDVYHVKSEEHVLRNATPKQSTNLQDVLKPNLKVNNNKVGLGKRWLRKDGCADQSMGSADKGSNSDDEIEVVDAFSKRVASRGGDGEAKKKLHPTRKLANLARHLKPGGDSDSAGPVKGLSKRLRMEKLSFSEINKTDLTMEVPGTSRQGAHQENDMVPCPLCNKLFEQSTIEEHASDCNGSQEEPSWIPTRTPKNKHRCYICQSVFDPSSYNDHVVACVNRKRTMQMEMPMECGTPEVKDVEIERSQKENNGHSLLSRLDTPKIGVASSARTFNCVSAESPFANARSMHTASLQHQIEDGNFSLAHVSTPTLQIFKPISQLKDSLIDFKNQFPIARQGKTRRVTKRIKTKRRKKNIKAKKSPQGRKS